MAGWSTWKIMALNTRTREYSRISTEFTFYEDARKYFNEHCVISEERGTTLIDEGFAISPNGEYIYRIVG